MSTQINIEGRIHMHRYQIEGIDAWVGGVRPGCCLTITDCEENREVVRGGAKDFRLLGEQLIHVADFMEPLDTNQK
jgi:hypothetical protein